MTGIKRYFAFFVVLVCFITLTNAQDTTISIPDVVNVNSPFIPTLAPAEKVNTPAVAEAPANPLPTLSYTIIPVQFKTVSRLDIPKSIEMEKNRLTALKGNHIKLGFGNYTSPLAELYLHSKRNEYGAYGFSFRHLSANGPDDAKFADNNADLYGKRFFKAGTLLAGVEFAHNSLRYYGRNDSLPKPTDDSLHQAFTTIGVEGGWESKISGKNKMQSITRLYFYNLSDKWGAKENDLLVSTDFITNIKKAQLKLAFAYNFSGYTDSMGTLNRNFVHINPRYHFTESGFKLALGFNSSIYKDTAKVKFYFFPVAEVEYPIEKDYFIAQAGISGNLQKNNYRGFITENPFMGNRNQMDNTVNRLELYGGIKGRASANFGFNARVFYNKFNNMVVFIADSTVLRRFKPLYLDARVIRFNAEVSYQYSEKVRVSLAGNFYNYKIEDNAQKAWQLPTAEVKLNVSYNIGNKLYLSADVFLMNQRPATAEYSAQTPTNLKAFTDFNFIAEYRYRKTLSVFARVNNISAVRYQRWYNYPVMGINAMAGVTFSL